MYARIMVAIDDSQTARAALLEAANIARAQGAALCIVHIADETLLNTPPARIAAEEESEPMRQALLAEGMRLLQEAETLVGPEVVVESRLVESGARRIAEVIVDMAQQWPADLLVAGSHGRRGLARLILGSVAEQLLRLANMSLLIVRRH